MGRVNRPRPSAVVALAVTTGYAALQLLGRTYGSTREERRRALPGDEVVSRPDFAITHAATVQAPPERVWPWLVQVGWHRAGWYTPRWVDRLLFTANAASVNEIHPEWQNLAVGDFVPDGAPETECGFTVIDLEADRHLVLHSTSHLPLSWRRKGWASVDWSWSFILQPVEQGGQTRLVFRWRAIARPWWLRALAWALIVPADAVMSRGMLKGVALRAERHTRVTTPGGGPARLRPPVEGRDESAGP